jgi:hypothetical protein
MEKFTYLNILKFESKEDIEYRGLFRSNYGEWDLDSKKHPIVKFFYSQSIEARNIPFNQKNLALAINVKTLIDVKKENCDLIVCTNQIFCDHHFELLGYDICSKSLYYSPIGSGGVSGNAPYLLKYMDVNFQNELVGDLNSYGLLETRKIADKFSFYCSEHAFLIESEQEWFTVSIFSYKVENTV